MQVTTKFNIGAPAFIVELNAIQKKEIVEIDTTDTSSAETIVNKTKDAAGNEGSYPDTQLFATPQEAADALVAAYEAANAPAPTTLPAVETQQSGTDEATNASAE